jgi:branched-chain amino acid transport system substrate-binding protein
MSKKMLINVFLVLAMLLTLVGAASAAPLDQEELTYTVKLGDNLWTLSEKYLGSGVAYWGIVGATNAKAERDSSFTHVENANLIHPGWKLLIPSVEEAEQYVSLAKPCEGLEGETITFYSQAGLTGALSTILGPGFSYALNDSIAALNEAGGICGATVVLDLVDTQYEAEQEIAVYQTRREADPPPISIATYGSAASIVLAPLLNEDHIVNFAAGLNANAFYVPRDGWTVGVAPIYSDQFAGFLQFLTESWDDIKPEGAGDEIVVGVIGFDSAFGAGATTPEALTYAESVGVTVLELEVHPMTADADLATPLLSLVSQGANVIYYQGLGPWTAMTIGTIHALGMWDSLVVGGCNWSMNSDVLAILGEGAPAMIGYYGVFPLLGWNDTDNKGVQQALAAYEAGGYPEAYKGVSYLMSYGGTFAWADITKRAISNVGFENLDGDAFFDAFKEMGTVSALGIFHYDVRDGTRAPRESQIRQAQLVDGEIQFVVVKDFFELPDTRPPAE